MTAKHLRTYAALLGLAALGGNMPSIGRTSKYSPQSKIVACPHCRGKMFQGQGFCSADCCRAYKKKG
jgi:hypothetical protein